MTPKTFNPPSNKEYQRVFEFLTFEIMGSFRILGRPEEEMLKALKELGLVLCNFNLKICQNQDLKSVVCISLKN